MKAIVFVIVLSTTGCFAAQYDSINESADNQLSHLNRQCKNNMTEWCQVQYRIVQENRLRQLEDLEARRHHFAHIMSEMGKGMQRNNNVVQCTSTKSFGTVYTTCR